MQVQVSLSFWDPQAVCLSSAAKLEWYGAAYIKNHFCFRFLECKYLLKAFHSKPRGNSTEKAN